MSVAAIPVRNSFFTSCANKHTSWEARQTRHYFESNRNVPHSLLYLRPALNEIIMRSKTTIISLLLFSLEGVAGQSRVFVDDHGVEHTTDKANPTFVTRARNALFFIHHGADTSQILATCTYGQS